jgi:hypothetical protein
MMSTLTQIEALKQQVTQLTGELIEIESRFRSAKRSFQSAKRKLHYLRAAQGLRKPAERYELWNLGILIVGSTFNAAVTFVLSTLIGASGGLTFFVVILAAIVALVILAVMLNIPATHSLPSLIADRGTEAQQFHLDAEQLEHESKNLRQKISATKTAIKELLESDRLQRETLLRKNWKAMRDDEWEVFLEEVFNALGAHVVRIGKSGDQGVDLIVMFGDIKLAVQAKGYLDAVNNKAVQEAVAGKAHHKCNRAAVFTNSRFRKSAIDLAKSNQCFLIGEQEFPAFVLGSNLELFK